MKVSIITIHDPDVNYGSTLQSCGTYNYVKNLGYDAEIINYKPQYKSMKQRLKITASKLLFLKDAFIRRKKINSYFSKHAKLSRVYKGKNELVAEPPLSDVYIAGSDVIWNRDVNPEGSDPSFYLRFVKNGIKMSYAPSMGELQPKENIQYIIDNISDFSYISVREEKSKEQLIQGGLQNVQCVMDPVFLLDKDYYLKQITKNHYGEYTLVYLMSETVEKRNSVSLLSEKYGDKVIAFGGLKKKSKCDLFVRNAGIEDFLSLIFYANHIITDSFHCIAFSLIFNKQFLYLPSIDSSMRIENILEYANLSERIIDKDRQSELLKIADNVIDYADVNDLLKIHINNSKEYLRKSLLQCNSMERRRT